MAPPAAPEDHGTPLSAVLGWLAPYWFATPGTRLADNSTIRLGPDDDPQPDAFLYILPTHGGQAKIEGKYVVGAPELVVEVAATSASYDLHIKLPVYKRHGVKEYIVWRVYDRKIDWFVLRAGRYVRHVPSRADHIHRSRAFPGLWLHAPSLLRGDYTRMAAIGQQGIESPEHAAFVEQLAKRAARSK